jgi:hypothetical protein
MVDPRYWVAPLGRGVHPGLDDFAQLAVDTWCNVIRRVSGDDDVKITVTAVHATTTVHVGDVNVDDVPYLLMVEQDPSAAWQVVARAEADVRSSVTPDAYNPGG